MQVNVFGTQVEAASSVGPYVPTTSVSASGSGATATFTVANLDAGSHDLIAAYPGDSNISPSSSASGSAVLTVGKTNASSITVTSNANPATYNQSITFTVNVGAVDGITPTGSVTLLSDGNSIGSGTLTNGSVTITTSALPAGTHSIVAQYGGDANYDTGTSSPLSEVVNKANPSSPITVASAPNPSTFGSAVTFTATLPADATVGSTVSFLDGGTSIGTGSVVAGGTATFSTSTLSVGSHTITISWGDSNYTTTTSTAITQTVQKTAANVTIATSLNPSTYGNLVVFTGTLTGVNGVVPTGTVKFTVDGTNVGGPVALDGTGKATQSTSALTAGSHTVVCTYNGDGSYY